MTLPLGPLLIIAAAMAVGSFIKGATGQGLPPVAIPVMAAFLGVEAAVVIMAIPGIVTNTWLLWNYRSYYGKTRDLVALLSTGIVGAIAGTVALHNLDEAVLSLVLAAVIGFYAVVFFTHPDLRLPEGVTRFTSPPLGLGAGLLQGATGISGPLISTYVHGFRLEKQAYVLTITTVFQIFALVQAITMAVVGLYTTERLVLSLLALIPAMAFLGPGARVAARLSRRTFDLVILAVLLASAARLVYVAFN